MALRLWLRKTVVVKTGTILRTLRHLKPSQLGHQVVNRVRQRVTGPPVLRGGSESVERIRWQPAGSFPRPLHGETDDILSGRFEFVSERHDCAFPPGDWDAAAASKLWQYNLHYFDWIWSLVPENSMLAVADWIEQHAPARGRVGWDAYPLSLRLMNWVMYFCGEYRGWLELKENRGFRQRLFASLTGQAECLLRCQEKHLLANHYLENGAALALVGACFDGETAAQVWSCEGLRILDEQLSEQCPADGLHFERSPMYHQRLVLVLEMLIASGNVQLIERAQPVLERTRRALAQVCHPDGDIALLADSALEIYPMPSEKLKLRSGAFELKDAGYFGYRSANGDYVICDYGAPSPAYNPGHAHAGLFSFELSIGGSRVISDSGAATYQPGAERSWARSTAAHNTVELDGEDQAEVWGAFRMGRRPQIRNLKWQPSAESGGEGFVIEAEHDGYLNGTNPRTHWRRISFDADARCLRVEDRITAKRGVTSARIALHLQPGIRAESDANGVVILDGKGKNLALLAGGWRHSIRQSAIYRRFLQREMRSSVVYAEQGQNVASTVEISAAQ